MKQNLKSKQKLSQKSGSTEDGNFGKTSVRTRQSKSMTNLLSGL